MSGFTFAEGFEQVPTEFARNQYDRRQQAILAALSSVNDLVFIYDDHYFFVYANQSMLDLWGVESDDVVGHAMRELVADDDLADILEQQIDSVLKTGEIVRATTPYTSPTGRSGVFEYILRRYDHDGGAWVVGTSRDISDLQNVNEQLSDILESITDAFYALDPDFRFTYVNRRAAELLMRDRDELIGQSVWEAFPESAETVLWPTYRQAMDDFVPRSVEFFYAPLETWFEVHAHPSPEMLSVYFKDSSESVRAQRELLASERRYRTLTNAMPQMVWQTDPSGYHLYYNDRWYEFTGMSREESLGFGFSLALHPQDRERTLQIWNRALRDGSKYEIEYRFYSRELDEYRWFLGRAFPVQDDEGKILEWVGTCTDIDPQKRAEARMKDNERRLAEAQRIARIGNWEFNVKTGSFSCSPEHMRIFGTDDPADQCNAESYILAIHPEDRSMVRIQRDRVMEQGFGEYDIEYRIIRPDGEQRVIHTLAELIPDESGEPSLMVGTVHDVTERKEIEQSLEDYAHQQAQLSRQLQQLNESLEQQVEARTSELRRLSENLEQMVWERTAELEESRAELAHQAQHDSLTGLPNRTLFEDRLEHAIASAERSGKIVAVVFLDLDGFKMVNDTFGHAAGDTVLCTVARRLQERLRRNDTLARHGGDEFIAILEGLLAPEDALPVAQDLLRTIVDPYTIEGRPIRLSASIGVALYPQDAQTVAGLQRSSDVAMYRAKVSGKNDIRFFSPSMNAAAEERHEIALQLTTALQNHELQVHFQPQWNVREDRVEMFEALLRWFNPVLGSVSPARLIPIAEEIGMINEIGNWVLDEACHEASRWSDVMGRRIGVSVNISATQLDREDLVDVVSSALDRHRLAPSQLELELTESAVAIELDRSIERLSRLREIGVRIAMDDFGLGSSSLSKLVRLPLDTIKIDRAFARDLAGNSASDRVVQVIVALTRGIGLEVVAEGVETVSQRERVIELGCDRVQGFLLGYPTDSATTLAWLKSFTPPDPPD
ncbi:MAG: EAL domain-containing protein [Sphaerobacteraceae bacterium]|nr:MAG: EAL domain-containing protein [Sphaerobacteraceae bacterium]